MTRLLRFLARGLRDFRRREDGSLTAEFAILFPAFIMIFLSAFESGLLMTRQVMLEHAVDVSVRDLRLGTWQPAPTHAELKQRICDTAGIIPDCMNSLLIELREVDQTTWAPLDTTATCIDRSQPIAPQLPPNFSAGTDNDLMLVRVCAAFKPLFPMSNLGMKLVRTPAGDYALVATTAFVNEPSS